MKKIADIIPNVLLVLALLFLGYTIFAASSDSPVFIFGYKPVRILSGSMEPAIKTNAVVLIKKVPPSDIREGDVVLYKFNGSLVTHRVIEVSNDCVQTKGDNNNTKDPYTLSTSKIYGKAVYVANWASVIFELTSEKLFQFGIVFGMAIAAIVAKVKSNNKKEHTGP